MWRGRKGNKETSPQISCIRETVRGASASAQTEPVWTFPTALFNLKRTEQEMVMVKLWHEKFYSWIQRKDRLARRWTQWRMERTRVTSITYWARQVPISQHQRRQLGASCAPDTRTQWTGCCLCICACVQPFGSLGDLSCEQPSVADGVLQRLLQALQLVTSTLEGIGERDAHDLSAGEWCYPSRSNDFISHFNQRSGFLGVRNWHKVRLRHLDLTWLVTKGSIRDIQRNSDKKLKLMVTEICITCLDMARSV